MLNKRMFLWTMLEDFFGGSRQKFNAWMATENPLLGGAIPENVEEGKVINFVFRAVKENYDCEIHNLKFRMKQLENALEAITKADDGMLRPTVNQYVSLVKSK